MAATLSLDTLTSAGSGITVAAGKTLTVEGVSVTAGSSNIQRATADKTIGTDTGYEVNGKSEVVVAANAGSSNRTITLPAVDAVGMDTCIITVVADADATSTYELKVQDAGSTEVWTGFQKGDFVRLIVSNNAWLVVDHKETMFSSRYMAADISVGSGATTKMTGFTNITDIGKVWDDANNKLVSPFSGFWDINWRTTANSGGQAITPALYVGGALQYHTAESTAGDGFYKGQSALPYIIEVAASTDIEFYAKNVYNGGAYSAAGGELYRTSFSCKFTRTY